MDLEAEVKRVSLQAQAVATEIVELDKKRQGLANALVKLQGALEELEILQASGK